MGRLVMFPGALGALAVAVAVAAYMFPAEVASLLGPPAGTPGGGTPGSGTPGTGTPGTGAPGAAAAASALLAKWLGPITVGVYLLGLLGLWATAGHLGWRGVSALSSFAIFLGILIVGAFLVLLSIQTGGIAGAASRIPLYALADNSTYIAIMFAALAFLMLIVSLIGALLLPAMAGRGGPIWSVAGLVLLIASLSMAAALGMLLYGALQDPSLANTGAQVMRLSFYAHIAAWLLTGLAILVSMFARRHQ